MNLHHSRNAAQTIWSIYPIVFFTIAFPVVLCQQVQAQSLVLLDSLKRVAAHAKTDSEKIKVLTALADHYEFNSDSEFYYGTLARDAAAKAGDKGAEAYALGDIGQSFVRRGNYAQGLKIASQILKTFQELKDTARMANTYAGLGEVYLSQRNFELAIKYFQTCVQLAQSINDYQDETYGRLRLSNAYSGQGKLDTALYFAKLALHLVETKQLQMYSRSALLLNIATIYDAQHQEALCDQNLQEALSDALQSNNAYLSNIQMMYANRLFQQNRLDSALYYATIAAQSIENNGQLDIRYSLNNLLAQICGGMKQYEQGYHYQAKALQLKDSLFNLEQSQQVANFTFNEQQHRLDLHRGAVAYQNRLRLYSALAVLVLAVVVVFFLLNRTKKQQRANTLLQQQKEETETQRTKAEAALADLKSTQTQLVQREKMASLGELTAGIAHEIQNPLNFVNNFSEINTELIEELRQEAQIGNTPGVIQLADELKENQQKVATHGRRADAIVKGMLQHSRASMGNKELCDINALVDEYLRLSYHGIRAKDKTFEAQLQMDLDGGVGQVAVVPQEVGRALLNLFNNAFYAVNEKKKLLDGTYAPMVTVHTKRLNKAMEIQVTDNGTGIPQQVVSKIFQPFFTTKPTGEGTGLGLSLSYDIVKAHGGEFSVESQEGQFTTFIVRFPT